MPGVPKNDNFNDESSSTDDEKSQQDPGNIFKVFGGAGPIFGSGIQLAAAVVFFFFVGRWLDGKFGTGPWLMLLGALIGAGGGLYNFIKTALDVSKSESEKKNSVK